MAPTLDHGAELLVVDSDRVTPSFTGAPAARRTTTARLVHTEVTTLGPANCEAMGDAWSSQSMSFARQWPLNKSIRTGGLHQARAWATAEPPGAGDRAACVAAARLHELALTRATKEAT